MLWAWMACSTSPSWWLTSIYGRIMLQSRLAWSIACILCMHFSRRRWTGLSWNLWRAIQSSDLAELKAVRYAIQWSEASSGNVVIWTDSAYVATGVNRLLADVNDVPEGAYYDEWICIQQLVVRGLTRFRFTMWQLISVPQMTFRQWLSGRRTGMTGWIMKRSLQLGCGMPKCRPCKPVFFLMPPRHWALFVSCKIYILQYMNVDSTLFPRTLWWSPIWLSPKTIWRIEICWAVDFAMWNGKMNSIHFCGPLTLGFDWRRNLVLPLAGRWWPGWLISGELMIWSPFTIPLWSWRRIRIGSYFTVMICRFRIRSGRIIGTCHDLRGWLDEFWRWLRWCALCIIFSELWRLFVHNGQEEFHFRNTEFQCHYKAFPCLWADNRLRMSFFTCVASRLAGQSGLQTTLRALCNEGH